MNNEYIEKADKFLSDAKTTLKIEKSIEQNAPIWTKKGEKHGIKYICTLENTNGKYAFDFWDSIHNAEIIEALDNLQRGEYWNYKPEHYQAERILKNNGINIYEARKNKEEIKKRYIPNSYDVLACLNLLSEDNFEDFCSSYGYETDSILALKTFEAVKEQDRNLRKLFERSELEMLSDIQ